MNTDKMDTGNRIVNTPRVEVGSEQYKKDVALMKLFKSYEEYLSYLAVWQGADTNWSSCHYSTSPRATFYANLYIGYFEDKAFWKLFDSYEDYLQSADLYFNYVSYCKHAFFDKDLELWEIFSLEEYCAYRDYCRSISSQEVCCDSPFDEEYLVKDRSRAARRVATAKARKHQVELFEAFELSYKPYYKRTRVLQPQCVSIANTFIDDSGKVIAITPFDSSDIYYVYPYVRPDYDDLGDSFLEVIGLRISEKSSKFCQDREHRPKMSKRHANVLYELDLIMSTLPRISKKTAKALLKCIRRDLEAEAAQALLKHIHKYWEAKKEKISAEGWGSGTKGPFAHNGHKHIPTYVNRRPVYPKTPLSPNRAIKETPAHMASAPPVRPFIDIRRVPMVKFMGFWIF